MKIEGKNFNNVPLLSGKVRKITYADGGTAYVFKKCSTGWQSNPTRRHSFPPVKRNEPMTKTAYRRTLNRNFGKLIELDLDNDKCLFLTLTIRKESTTLMKKLAIGSKISLIKCGAVTRSAIPMSVLCGLLRCKKKAFFIFTVVWFLTQTT